MARLLCLKLLDLTPNASAETAMLAAIRQFIMIAALIGVSCWAEPLSAAVTSDVVVLRNGDFHVGTVAQETFTIETANGDIAIAYGMVATLYFSRGPDEVDILISADGERFSGRLRERSLFVLRGVLGASLPVDVADVDRIQFHRPELRPALPASRDVITLRGGDRFRGRVLSDGFIVRSDDGLHQLGRADIAFMDFDTLEEETQARVQVRLRGGDTVIQGALFNSSVLVRTRYGQELDLPAAAVGSLAFNALGSGQTDPPALRRAAHPGGKPVRLIVDQFDDETPGPEMVVINKGTYMRGDHAGDGDGDEKPLAAISIPKPFAIGLFPVTFAEYDRFADTFGRPNPDDQGWGRADRPVVNVSWEDAVTYAKWLSRATGRTYRLPTDAEWEYAARAGTMSRFWWGDEAGTARANCAECGSLWSGEKSAPAGRFPANPFGLYDMAGNVWQWVADCWHDKAEDFPTDGTALDKEGCGKRIIRGGAWSFPPKEMRAANRWRDFPTRSSDDTGFRLVRELE